MSTEHLIAGPYTHAGSSISRTMGLVMLALTPATLFGLIQFGWPAIFLFLVTVAAAVAAEAACLGLAGKPSRPFLLDGSAVLTGWLLAMTLPPSAPWWIGVVGSLIAIVVAKHVFGGIGQNLFNPAMVARVALLISFPLEMTTWMEPAPLFSGGAPGFIDGLAVTFGLGGASFDAVTGATVLGHLRTELGQGAAAPDILADSFSAVSGLFGSHSGSMGETSALLILGGGLFLLYKGVITWHIPVSLLATVALLSGIMHLADPAQYAGPLVHLLSGATLLGAFFIATDLVTSPVSARGQLIFGAGCGLLIYVVRTWSGYPEGVAFAVMLMNACTPLIDHWTRPRIYGRDRRGKPLDSQEPRETAVLAISRIANPERGFRFAPLFKRLGARTMPGHPAPRDHLDAVEAGRTNAEKSP